MAQMLEMSHATTHRYAATLVALGWLEQTRERKYRLGSACAWPGLAVLGEIVLAAGAEPVLRELRARTGYTASLGVLDGDRVVYVRRLHAHQMGQYEAEGGLRAGVRVPLHCTAVGKALLASLPEEELRDLLAGLQLERHTPHTITVKKRLCEEVEQARTDGVAVSDRELNGRERSLAVAIAGLCRERRLAMEVTVPVALGVEALRTDYGGLVCAVVDELKARLQAVAGPFCPQSAGGK